MKTKTLAFLMFGLIASMWLIPEFGNAFAETLDIKEIAFDTNTGITVILLGVGAGLLIAFQGYRITKQDWDTLKFFDGVIKAVLGSVPIAIMTAIGYPHIGIIEGALIFLACLGLGSQIHVSTKKTIMSNEG